MGAASAALGGAGAASISAIEPMCAVDAVCFLVCYMR